MTNEIEPLNAEMLTADLRSGDPDRVADALETLDRAWRRRRFVPLPLPGPECLAAFDDNVPVEVLARYLRVVENYPDFAPTPSGSALRRALVEAVVRYGRGERTLDVALVLRVDDFPASAVSDALGYLRNRGVSGPGELLAAQRLVDHLLGSDTTRRATVDVLRIWAMTDCLVEVIDAVRPRLDDDERALLDSNGDD
ncbi:MAG: hypothetical protein WD696_07805 [Bryobacteraceae bacterium]